MASRVKKVFQAANRFNDVLLPQFENLKQRKLGKSAYSVYVDYKAVFVDLLQSIKTTPVKAASKFAVLGGLYIVYRFNPDERIYHDLLVSNSVELLQISPVIRNPASDAYTQDILHLYYEGRIKRQNFGLFSVMSVNEFNKDLDIYEKQCYYTAPRWLYMWKQVIDIGILGHWVCLERSMVDFDINTQKLANLPDDVEEGNVYINKARRLGSDLVNYMEDCYNSVKESLPGFSSSDSES